MKKRSKLLSFFIGLLRFVLVFTLTISIFAATFSVFINDTLLNKQFYKAQLTSDTYIDEIYGFIGKAVKSSSLYYGLPYEEIMDAVTKDSVKDLSAKYSDEMYENLINGAEMNEISYSSDAINEVLKNFFTKENYDVNDETIKLISDDIAKTISANIVVVRDSYGSVNLFKPLSKYIFANKFIVAFARYSPWIIVGCAVLTVLSLLLSASSFKTRLYNVANVYWLAGCVMFIPVLFFKNHDIFSKIALSESPLKSFVDIIGTPIIDNLLSVTRVIFIISCIILAIAIIVYIVSLVFKYKNKDEEDKEATDRAEDDDDTGKEIDLQDEETVSNAKSEIGENNDSSEESEKPDKKTDKHQSNNIADIVNDIYDDKPQAD